MAPAQYPAMLRKGTRWCGASAVLSREDAMGTSWWSADDWRRKAWALYQKPWPGESRAGSAPTGTPDQAEQGETNLRQTPLAVNAGVPP
jgi:hypothetical protein